MIRRGSTSPGFNCPSSRLRPSYAAMRHPLRKNTWWRIGWDIRWIFCTTGQCCTRTVFDRKKKINYLNTHTTNSSILSYWGRQLFRYFLKNMIYLKHPRRQPLVFVFLEGKKVIVLCNGMQNYSGIPFDSCCFFVLFEDKIIILLCKKNT